MKPLTNNIKILDLQECFSLRCYKLATVKENTLMVIRHKQIRAHQRLGDPTQ